MSYFLVILSFVAAIIAIFGDTTSPDKTGQKKVNWLGKLTAVVATICLVISLLIIKAENNENESLKNEIKSIRQNISQQEVVYAKYHIRAIPNSGWQIPLPIPSGAVVEFEDFEGPLELWRGRLHQFSVEPSIDKKQVVNVVGIEGDLDGRNTYTCTIVNKNKRLIRNGGTVSIYATAAIIEELKNR